MLVGNGAFGEGAVEIGASEVRTFEASALRLVSITG
jgi:hypothetical protein